MSRLQDVVSGSTQAVYGVLRQRFADGEYAPGERLTEAALAADLGVSRTPVREAIHRLQADGLVVSAARGVAVAALTVEELQDLYVLRADLEGLAAELAASQQRDGRLAPSDVDALDRLVEEVERAVAAGDVRAVVKANLLLHRAIGTAAGNAFLLDALNRVWDRLAVSTVTNVSDPSWAAQITDQHRAIVTAVRAGEPDAARAAAKAHIDAARAAYAAHG